MVVYHTFDIWHLGFVLYFILLTPILRLAFCGTVMMTIVLCVAKISTSHSEENVKKIAFQNLLLTVLILTEESS